MNRARAQQIEQYAVDACCTQATAKRHRRMPPTERQIRTLRFLWMRGNLTPADLPALNWINIGGLVCRRLLNIPHDDHRPITLTPLGEAYVLGKIHHLRRK